MTGKELIAKVAARCETGRDPVEATGWWIANQEAAGIWDLNSREMASMVQGGSFPGPFQTEAHISDWIKDEEDASEGDTPGRWDSLDDELDEWFGLKTRDERIK